MAKTGILRKGKWLAIKLKGRKIASSMPMLIVMRVRRVNMKLKWNLMTS
jgi:hypothetical protein